MTQPHTERQLFWWRMFIYVIVILIIICYGEFCFFLGKATTMKYVLAHPICGEAK